MAAVPPLQIPLPALRDRPLGVMINVITPVVFLFEIGLSPHQHALSPREVANSYRSIGRVAAEERMVWSLGTYQSFDHVMADR